MMPVSPEVIFAASFSMAALGTGRTPKDSGPHWTMIPFTQTLPTAVTLMVTVGAGRPY